MYHRKVLGQRQIICFIYSPKNEQFETYSDYSKNTAFLIARMIAQVKDHKLVCQMQHYPNFKQDPRVI